MATLGAGSRIGAYEVLQPIGSGGMGEVYRARDPRLKREVAIKVLPQFFSADTDRLRRFEQEAQAAGSLNHPAILSVYELGSHDGAPYIVTELLEGETLRSRIAAGALPLRKAIEYGIQIARGLSAAHEKGIVHRDLKPENVFVTRDGRVKILDFGLAKLTEPEVGGAQTNLPTAGSTEPGVVLGTLGYMSPEQLRGKPADRRSDLFSLGAILYEMVSGQRAFRGETAADTITAILTKEPPDLSVTSREVPPGLDRIIRHCLEKNPEERFESARDVAFDLEALSGVSIPQPAVPSAHPRPRSGSRVLLVALVAAAAILGYAAAARRSAPSPAVYRQVTFRRGTVWSARFGPDGKSILYSASWDGKPSEVFLGSLESPESRAIGLPGASLFAVSPSGDAAVSLDMRIAGEFVNRGTLARTSAIGGAAPRQILDDVQFADWDRDGKDAAIVRAIGGRTRLEYPIGRTLYETVGWVGNPRISPRGDRVAFIDHPSQGDDGGSIAVVDTGGKKQTLSRAFGSAQGVAWSPDGSEVWFTAAEVANRTLRAVSLSGRMRVIADAAGSLTLQDVARDGRALVIHESRRLGMSALAPGETKERDLSWLDWSRPAGLSRDGKSVLFYESGEGGGAGYSVYVRGMDGSPAVRLGEGQAMTLSPDGKWALSVLHKLTDPELVLYPTGVGQPRHLATAGLRLGASGRFLPDGRRFLVVASEAGKAPRFFVLDIEGGKPRPVTEEGSQMIALNAGAAAISPDGNRFIARAADGSPTMFFLDGRPAAAVQGVGPADALVGWTADGQSVYVQRSGAPAARIERLDLATSRAEPWMTFLPPDPTGIIRISSVFVSPDGKSYVYAYSRNLCELFVVEGLR
jgi:serine/threonine protein kinase